MTRTTYVLHLDSGERMEWTTIDGERRPATDHVLGVNGIEVIRNERNLRAASTTFFPWHRVVEFGSIREVVR